MTEEQAEAAYRRYCPESLTKWEHLMREERFAWLQVALHMPAQEKAPEPEQPKVKSLGQICYEAAWEGQPERSWAPCDAQYWEKAAQAVAVAVLHMRYDEFTPELRAAAEEGTRRGAEWINRPDGPASREDKVQWAMDQPIVDALQNAADLSVRTRNAIHMAIVDAVMAALRASQRGQE